MNFYVWDTCFASIHRLAPQLVYMPGLCYVYQVSQLSVNISELFQVYCHGSCLRFTEVSLIKVTRLLATDRRKVYQVCSPPCVYRLNGFLVGFCFSARHIYDGTSSTAMALSPACEQALSKNTRSLATPTQVLNISPYCSLTTQP